MEALAEIRIRETPSFGGAVSGGLQKEDPFQEINSPAFLEELRSGRPHSQRAFRRLVLVTHPKLVRFLGRYLRSSDCIQEALQETYLGVHRGLARFEGKCRLTTWIYSLAYRKACDCLAQKYRRNHLETEVETDEDIWGEFGNREIAADEALHQTRLVQEILAAAKVLPAIYREAYQLRDVDGLSGEDAASVLGISETLIRVRLHRARSLIVERLRKKIPTLFATGVQR
jgi:RNA polymerase sigma factor (sigma-70 family)